MDADVGVIGVGTIGSMALWRLLKAGLDDVGFEQFNPEHGFGGAAGETRYFRTAYAEGAAYVPLLLSAYGLWKELQATTETPFIWQCGLLTIAPETDGRFDGARTCAEAFDLDYEILDPAEAAKRFPQQRYRDDDFVLVDPLAGLYASEFAVAHTAHIAERAGAVIHRQTRVERIEPDSDGVTVTANGRSYRFGKVIVSTGAWAGELMPEIKPIMEPRRTWQSWYPTHRPERFLPEVFPPFGRTLDGIRLHGAPTLDGRLVCIGAVEELPETTVDDAFLGARTLPDMSTVNAYVRDYFEDIGPDLVRIVPALDGYTSDDHALIGTPPQSDRIVLMSGFSNHGFKLAPIMGEVAVDLAVSGKTRQPIDHLRLERFDATFGR